MSPLGISAKYFGMTAILAVFLNVLVALVFSIYVDRTQKNAPVFKLLVTI
jgi:hypothetical protein